MRIGIMLRHYDQHGGGVRVYTQRLLSALLQLRSGHEFVFFYRNPALVGTYVFGRGAADRIEISLDKGNLMFQRTGMPFGRGLTHLGNKTFHPAGAAAVKVAFATSGGATTLTVTDGDIVVTATRRT